MEEAAAIKIEACVRGYLTRKRMVFEVRQEFFEVAEKVDDGVLRMDAKRYLSSTLGFPSSLRTLPKIWRRKKVKMSKEIVSVPISNRTTEAKETQSTVRLTNELGGGNAFSLLLIVHTHTIKNQQSDTFHHHFHTVVPSLENMSTDDIERELLWAKKALEMRRLVLLRNRDD